MGFPGAGVGTPALSLSSALGIGVYSALTAKLMTVPDPSRCSGKESRPWGPRG